MWTHGSHMPRASLGECTWRKKAKNIFSFTGGKLKILGDNKFIDSWE